MKRLAEAMDENPYTVGELEFSEWQSGWYSGYIEEYGGA